MSTEKEVNYMEVADAIDEIDRFQALVTVRYYLAGHSHEQIAGDLGLSEREAMRLAAGGLQRIKTHIFST